VWEALQDCPRLSTLADTAMRWVYKKKKKKRKKEGKEKKNGKGKDPQGQARAPARSSRRI